MRFGQKALFEDVTVKFTPGNCYGLVGANGSGKSTFMKILAGLQPQSSGEVFVEKDCTLGYLRQDHAEFDEVGILDAVYMGNQKLWSLHCEREHLYSGAELTPEEEDRCEHIEEEYGDAGGYTMEADAAKLLKGLGFEETAFENQMKTLQGGFKLRILLAQVLFAHPDILLLDEPTNHLDMESIEWLVGFLNNYEGTVIVISHDRFFLNQVSTHIADVDYHEIRMFTGNYDDFTMAQLEAREQQSRQNAKAIKQVNDLKAFISRFSANASKAKQATSRRKQLEKITIEKVKPSSRVSPFIRFAPTTRLGEKVIEAKEISKAYDAPVITKLSCLIGPKDKIAIVGKNGIGKTTLLKMLAGQLAPDSGEVVFGETAKISVFPQEASETLDQEAQAIDWLRGFSENEISETELRSFMGRMLFSGDSVFKTIKVLSGGEKARLILARMMLEDGNVLILDEPTNHLDLESIEALNYALSIFEKTVVFVSHDHRLISTVANKVFELSETGICDRSDHYLDN
jgi:ATPase subunit of ABC transporter with duplicated ATPase domains